MQQEGQDPQQKPQSSTRIWGNGAGDFWRDAKDELRTGYNNRCVYSCFFLEDERQQNGNLGSTHSIDHFQPKSRSPAYLAYEWSNLRWAWNVIDNKGKKDNLIPEEHDPTQLARNIMKLQEDDKGDWIVVPGSSLTASEQKEIESLIASEQKEIEKTIRALGLNKPKVKIRRKQHIEDFLENKDRYDADSMKERQPFIYRELKRLGWL